MTKPNGFRKYSAKILNYLGGVIFTGCLYHCITQYIVDLAICSGNSMEPTLHDKDIFLVRKVFSYSDFKRGDIVILKKPTDPRKFWCKRLVGLPGDKVSFNSNLTVVPVGSVWLEGDNPEWSIDSRKIGPVPTGLIVGKAVYTLWPSFLKKI